MTSDTLSRRTVTFVNIAHAFDHFVLLIYPTAVLAIAVERGLDYSTLITLATGAFVAFGLCSLPMGWIAEVVGRRNMLAAFLLGYGASCIAMAACTSSWSLAACLLVLGVFSAIYHPIGSAMLVSHARQLGRDLGWNGVWGNLGAAFASAVTAVLAAKFGWRWAFVVPGAVCIAVGIAFLMLVPGDGNPAKREKVAGTNLESSRLVTLLAILAIAIIAGGMTFNITTIALPKVIDEGIGISLPLVLTGSLATAVFIGGALTQLAVGRLLDRYSLPTVLFWSSSLAASGVGLGRSHNWSAHACRATHHHGCNLRASRDQ